MRLGKNQKVILEYLYSSSNWELYSFVQADLFNLYGIDDRPTRSMSASMSRSVRLLLEYGLIERKLFRTQGKNRFTGMIVEVGVDPGLQWELKITEVGIQKIKALGVTFD